jgi:histone H3/H4
MSYVVASQVKQLVNKMSMMASGDLSDGVSDAVEEMLSAAVKRAKANGRKTVRKDDL